MTHVAISRDADVDGVFDYSIAAHGRAFAYAYLRMIHAAFDRIFDFEESRITPSDQ